MAFILLLFGFIALGLFLLGIVILLIAIILFIINRRGNKSINRNIVPTILFIISFLLIIPGGLIGINGVISKHKRNKEYGVLYLNATNNNWDKVVALVEAGEDPDGIYEITPLMQACRIQNLEMVKFLVDKGADVNSDVRFSPIFYALDGSKNREDLTYKIIKYLIDNGADIDEDILLESCKYNNVDVVKLIVESDIDNHLFSSAPLVVAADFKSYDIVRYLISLEVDINKKNNYGDTALMKASDIIIEENISLITLLLENGADKQLKDQHNRTALNILKNSYNELKKEDRKERFYIYQKMKKLLSS